MIFLKRLPQGARILDLGCGGGRDSADMIRQGFRVEPTDGVPAMADKAAQHLGRPVSVLRFDQLEAREIYDAVWANASLLHVPRPALPDVLARIWRALKPEGWHFASFKTGTAEGRDRFDRYFNYPSVEHLRAAYEEAGPWSVREATAYEGGGYDGRKGPWAAMVYRKRG